MATKRSGNTLSKKPQGATDGIGNRLTKKDDAPAYTPNDVERIARTYVKRRVEEMVDFRKSLKVEERWREADEEYVPHELGMGGKRRKRFEQDQDTGRRSRMVPVGDATQEWRSDTSAPTLLAKIQTAVSIIVDNQPEADLVALVKKYEATTELAYALWKRNWSITGAREKLKLITFDGIKYGWMAQRTAPREVCYDKRVLLVKDIENPDNDLYENKKVYWFKDVDRQRLDPFRTWIDELSRPYDPYSTNECYYEIDLSYDEATIEYGKHANWKFVKRDSQYVRDEQSSKTEYGYKKRGDVVTLGFFESRHKDMYCIFAPKDGIVVYLGPLPNDDGYLSVTHSMWLLRNSNSPYGISLWEVIRQNKSLYDKMKNMTMDQLVLSIMKFGFFSGTNTQVNDGTMQIIPGQARQLTSSTGKPEVNWMEIPGPGQDAWLGLEKLSKEMADDSGISPTLEGEITGKTLGEILHAKEGSLKRLKLPVENLAWLIEQDAYITLSWMSQLYTVPTVLSFTSEEELRRYEEENQINHVELFGTPSAEEGTIAGPYEAHFLPQLSLGIEDSDGNLIESKQTQWFQVGKDIKPSQLKWKGIFKVRPRSLVDRSQTVDKATKMEMFNMLVPLLALPPEIAARPAQQIVKINEEDPKDWLPESFLQYLSTGVVPGMMQGAQPAPDQSIFVPQGGQSMQGQAGMTPPQAPTVVPKRGMTGGAMSIFEKKL